MFLPFEPKTWARTSHTPTKLSQTNKGRRKRSKHRRFQLSKFVILNLKKNGFTHYSRIRIIYSYISYLNDWFREFCRRQTNVGAARKESLRYEPIPEENTRTKPKPNPLMRDGDFDGRGGYTHTRVYKIARVISFSVIWWICMSRIYRYMAAVLRLYRAQSAPYFDFFADFVLK